MPIPISAKVQQLRPSPSMAAKQRVLELEAAGRSILDFCLGEPDFDTPAFIIDAAEQAMRAGDTHYTAAQGKLSLREAVSRKLATENGVDYAPAEIVIGNGAKQLIFEVLAATLSEGDEVIVPTPYWVSYPDIVTLNGGVPVITTCGPEVDFKLTPEILEAAITERTRWLIVNSPSNPTGAVYTRDEWLGLVAVLDRHPQVALMTDEIYEKIFYDDHRTITPTAIAPGLRDRCVVVNGMSKAYAMTGWRVGYAAGPVEVIKAVTKLLSQSTSCPCAFAQTAATVALETENPAVEQMLEAYAERRQLIVEGLNAAPGIACALPDAAFYVFADVRPLLGTVTSDGRSIATDIDLVDYLLDEASVAVMDGTSYGTPGFLRLSFAASNETIRAGVAAIAAAVSQLTATQQAFEKADYA
ncbi:aspartate aminotransferase [Pacificitalea manganoxidans]|uniref:Aminotransferase n=1 Tax=Pacificitalea manganoxidans TaxID=1411902 RepID=A0A291LYS0_9RHOB|nr:pyridoxal phosphate-dependent aminotransferase [Pacificitalea manganoxidans]ATI41777.1 aspartate aminotransferase [Pacificitalea manganoxidans]MDR6309241.1 aspartate aminotransferase [Pacificitalea manganoxidans]